MSETSGLKLLFLDTGLFDEGVAIRGGALITDSITRPLEFRCTSPVRPNNLQRILYGYTLEEYVHVELLSLPLVNEVKEKPSLIIVRNPLLLTLRKRISYPVVLVRHDQNAPVGDGSSNLKAIVLTSHREFPAETASAQSMLGAIMSQRDLLEPFERLSVALTEAHKQHIGDSSQGTKNA